jgi:hypothetical protein
MRMRFTIVDMEGAISFCGPGYGLKMLTAACSRGVKTHREMLTQLDSLDSALSATVRNGLSTFDEHCLKSDPATIRAWLTDRGTLTEETFRVLDDATRQASLQPARLGLVIFNLEERRIVQVQNSYGTLMRSDRGRIRSDSRPTGRYYQYELPTEWALVP